MKVVAIIQARMGSTRLPGKVLMEVGGKTILAHLIDRLRQVPLIDEIVVATTNQSRDDLICELCKRLEVNVCRGSEEDVLKRYLESAQQSKADVIFRATSDEPYKDPGVILQVLQAHLAKEVDYTCNNLPMTFPDGSTVEIINDSALETAGRLGNKPQDREHVTFYIRNRPDQFKIQNIEAEGKLRRPDLRYCLDTREDLEVIRAIFDHLGWEKPYFTIEEIIDFLDQHHQIRNLNKDVQRKIITY